MVMKASSSILVSSSAEVFFSGFEVCSAGVLSSGSHSEYKLYESESSIEISVLVQPVAKVIMMLITSKAAIFYILFMLLLNLAFS